MNASPSPGALWLIPTPLGEASVALECLPTATRDRIVSLDYLIAENARSARAFLKQLPLERPIQAIDIRELNEHTPEEQLEQLLEPLLAGRDAGMLSEAGCPAVADPGANLVALAHRRGVKVHPLIGPSSILLALMGSGLIGQRFGFVGYLPQQPDERLRAARELEARSARHNETILMIETPYRNQAFVQTLLSALSPQTRLCIASDLSLPQESIITKTIAQWRTTPPVIAKVPTVFVLQAESGVHPAEASAERTPHQRRRIPSSMLRKPKAKD